MRNTTRTLEMGTSTLSAAAIGLQRKKFADAPVHGAVEMRKLTFRVEDRAGVVFVSSDIYPELMVVVKDREAILPALDESLRSC